VYEYNETMTVELEWQQTGVKHVGVAIFRENGEYVYGPNTYQEKVKIADKNRADLYGATQPQRGELFHSRPA